MKKVRIDKLLVDLGLVPSREKAQALLMAGLVLVDGVPVMKSGKTVLPDAAIRIRGQDHPYAGRGGVKLAHALKEFGVDVRGNVCMDVGASTGGFTDCLLQNGAAKVYAVDVGYGQMAPKISGDRRVIVMDRTNIRHLVTSAVPELLDIAVIDVSFISLKLVLPAVVPLLKEGAAVIALIKPQFEVGRELVGKGGIVRDAAAHRLAVDRVKSAAAPLNLEFMGVTASPIEGAKGNKEFLALFKKK